MTKDERSNYPEKMQKRYLKAAKKERNKLLDEMQTISKLHKISLM